MFYVVSKKTWLLNAKLLWPVRRYPKQEARNTFNTTTSIIAAQTYWFFPSRKQLSCWTCRTNGSWVWESRSIDRFKNSVSNCVVESFFTSSFATWKLNWAPCIQTPLQCRVGRYNASTYLLGLVRSFGHLNFAWSIPSIIQHSTDDAIAVVDNLILLYWSFQK